MKKALVQNSADEEQVKTAAKKEKFRRDDELNDLKDILCAEVGRRFLTRLISACRKEELPLRIDPHETYFHLGRESIAVFLEKEIKEASFDDYIKMLTEKQKEELNG